MWSNYEETLSGFATRYSTWWRAKWKTESGLRDADSRSESTAVNARKRGFGDGEQPVNKEAGQHRPGVIAFTSRASAPSFTTLMQQKKNPRSMRGSSLPISNGACPSLRPWSPRRRDPERTERAYNRSEPTTSYGYFLI